MKEQFQFEVNGLQICAEYDEADRTQIFLPLLARMTALQREKQRRIVVFLAAPPAAGKSTLCRYLETLSRQYAALTPVQCVGIDGFHLPNRILAARTIVRNGEEIPLRRIKGAPETYDVAALKRCIESAQVENARFPAYDRRIHDPVPDAIAICEPILIVEGNWLLLDEAPWNELRADLTVFLHAGDESQLERIVRRKMMGGFEEEAARAFVRFNDAPNIRRCMEHSRRADINLMPKNGKWVEI